LLTSAFKKINAIQGYLSNKDNLLMVLMLTMAVPNKALAYKFSITPGRVSQIFDEWIYVMARN